MQNDFDKLQEEVENLKDNEKEDSQLEDALEDLKDLQNDFDKLQEEVEKLKDNQNEDSQLQDTIEDLKDLQNDFDKLQEEIGELKQKQENYEEEQKKELDKLIESNNKAQEAQTRNLKTERILQKEIIQLRENVKNLNENFEGIDEEVKLKIEEIKEEKDEQTKSLQLDYLAKIQQLEGIRQNLEAKQDEKFEHFLTDINEKITAAQTETENKSKQSLVKTKQEFNIIMKKLQQRANSANSALTLQIQNLQQKQNENEEKLKLQEGFADEFQETKGEVLTILGNTQENVEIKLKQTQENITAQLQNTREDLEGKLQDVSDDFESELQDVSDDIKNELNQINEGFDAKLQSTSKDLKELEQSHDELLAQFAQVQNNMFIQLQRTQENVKEQINNTTDNFSAQLQETQENMRMQVEESSQQKLEAMRQQLDQYIKDTNKVVGTIKHQTEQKIEQIRMAQTKLQDASKEQIIKLREQTKNEQTTIKQLQLENLKLRSEIEKLTEFAQNAVTEEKINKLIEKKLKSLLLGNTDTSDEDEEKIKSKNNEDLNSKTSFAKISKTKKTGKHEAEPIRRNHIQIPTQTIVSESGQEKKKKELIYEPIGIKQVAENIDVERHINQSRKNAIDGKTRILGFFDSDEELY